MALICFGSAKGSPGVTFTALAVAALWSRADGRDVLLVEADPDGGVLALRYQLGRQPGLLTVAAAGRHGLSRDELTAHTQQLPGGLGVIVAPERPDRASAVLASFATSLGVWLASLPNLDVIVDCGRLHPNSPTLPLVAAADHVLLVARPTAEQVQPAAATAEALRTQGRAVSWVLIGEQPYRGVEVGAATGVPVAAVLPHEPRVAEAWANGSTAWGVRRSRLGRALRQLAAELAAPSNAPGVPTTTGAASTPILEAIR